MNNLTRVQEFETIYASTRNLNSIRKVNYFKQFPHEYLRSFQGELITDRQGTTLELYCTSLGELPHSVDRPARIVTAREDEIKYYLFGASLHQSAWFVILGYTEEEQLAHILKWGRHD